MTTGEVGALLTNERLLVMLPATVGVKLSENFVDWPGGTNNGKVRWLTLKPALGPAACVTLRLPSPVLLTVTAWVLVTPTVTLPKLMLAGAIKITGCTPVPLSEIVTELEASPATTRSPVIAPAAFGANWICTGTLCPAGIEEVVPPTTVKTEPEAVASETFAAAVPVFVMLRLCVAVFPIETFPKLTLTGLAERPTVLGAVLGEGLAVLGVVGRVPAVQPLRPRTARMAARDARSTKGPQWQGWLPWFCPIGAVVWQSRSIVDAFMARPV
jgi:hypothetical protein